MATASVTNVFVAGTTVLSAPVNTNFTDIINFLNGSVVQSDGSTVMTGQLTLLASDPTSANHAARKSYVDQHLPLAGGTMTGAVLLSDGTNSLPSGAFGSDPDSGVYRVGPNDVGVAAGGVAKFGVNGTGPYMPAHSTTGDTANAVINSGDGQIRRSTSSIRYKDNVQELEDSDFIDNLIPVTWDDKETQKPFMGFIAEWSHDAEPLTVQLDEQGDPENIDLRAIVAGLVLKVQKLSNA